jgi:predicted NAD/FAD-dependent oxidoreductase
LLLMKRRTFLGASTSAALLSACDWRGANRRAPIEGGFVGADHALGHRLRQAEYAAPSGSYSASVALIGGGVSALAAARQLRRAGIDRYRIFELEGEAGGNARGHAIAGMACPLGAHYLPVPGEQAGDVRELLIELGACKLVDGKPQYDERMLCHSPQERLLVGREWQDGLLPVNGQGADTLRDYRRFAQLVRQQRERLAFAIPTALAPWTPAHDALDRISFAQWLDAQQLTSPALRWYLDYCCRDDYGAGTAEVSAWAGLHYFASRHGFRAPGDAADRGDEREDVLTWPEGNAWLTRRLAEPHRAQLQTRSLALRIALSPRAAVIDVWNDAAQRLERWTAQQVIVCTPLFIAARLLGAQVPALAQAARELRYAPWLVANAHVPEPLDEWPGAPRAWDNVMMAEPGYGLGYVDAMHQSTRPTPASIGPTVLTYYMAFGTQPAQRQALYDGDWKHWCEVALKELAIAHPDIAERTRRVDIMRYGHAMATPVPGLRSSAALAELRKPQGPRGSVHFAHSDLSAYSVFEEAFHWGTQAGRAAAAHLSGQPRPAA